MNSSLHFDRAEPMAARALGGLLQDHFCNGRIFATVAAHGGVVALSYWGNQHLRAQHFFRGDIGTAWKRLFRLTLVIDGKRYHPTLNNTRLLPFGLISNGSVADISFRYEMLLLPDAMVQRVHILANPHDRVIGLEILHQEAVTAVSVARREWTDFVFNQQCNALITACTDERIAEPGDEAIAQTDFDVGSCDVGKAVTWIGASSDLPITARRGYHRRSKHYLETGATSSGTLVCHVVFAADEAALQERLRELATGVHDECDELLRNYELRASMRPRIRSGSAVLDSALSQYPEIIERLKITNRPGAVRATASGYFVWGWDGMMPLLSSGLANDAKHTAEVLRFFHETRHPQIGLPHQFTTGFAARLKSSFPAQTQYIAGLYLYVAHTGDLALAREVWPTCLWILDRCREHEVAGSGLVSGTALWPDFPEAMEETGADISSMNNSALYQALRGVEYLASALGEPGLASECRDWAVRLRVSFHRYLYDEQKGYFISSCSSIDFSPRKHYCAQAIFWLTPFANELVAHAPVRIATFMHEQLRSENCLLTLPHWDTAWMADGNQLGSSFPAADSFFIGVHKLAGDDTALKCWQGDVEWFWRYHTAPEAFTPEAENEEELGPDNTGAKQLQAMTTWYASAFHGLAGVDFDHEGITLSPCGETPMEICGLEMRGRRLDLRVHGKGRYLGGLSINGKPWTVASHKIFWADLGLGNVRIDWIRTSIAPLHPVITRADGLQIHDVTTSPSGLKASVSGSMTGTVVIRCQQTPQFLLNDKPVDATYDAPTSTFTLRSETSGKARLEVIL